MLGHRVFEPRWTVLPTDPAIDQDKSDPKRYAELGFDYKRAIDDGAIVLVGGEKPTQFKIAPIESKQRRVVASYDSDQEAGVERADYLLRAGLLAIKHWQEQRQDGTIVEHDYTLERRDYGRYGTCCGLDDVQALPLHMQHVMILANMIWKVSETDPFVSTRSEQPSGVTGR